jgi:hypothetical protein
MKRLRNAVVFVGLLVSFSSGLSLEAGGWGIPAVSIPDVGLWGGHSSKPACTTEYDEVWEEKCETVYEDKCDVQYK